QVKPDDDHLVHLQMIDGFIGYKGQQGTPIAPPQMALLMKHMGMHIGAARSDPQYWKAHAAEIEPFIQKMQDTMKGLQKQQAASAQGQMGLANLRGGGASVGMGSQPSGGGLMPNAPVPAAPPQVPVPGGPMAGQPNVPAVPGGNG